MPYQVIARKWRPQTFDEIVGQDHVTTTLKNALESGRIGHAFLFTGIRGIGKTTAARVLAKALNCEKGTSPQPCNECSSCAEVRKGTSLDVKEIDGASNRGIDSIRELREGVAFAPARDRYKVYIVDEVHMLTQEAFNALLKTLEEPPEHVVFIFATTELHKVPRTIASRCQVFEFKRISVTLLVDTLEAIAAGEGVEVSADALRVIAREADGSLRDASSLLDQVISFAGEVIDVGNVSEVLRTGSRSTVSRALGAVLSEDAAEAVRAFMALMDMGAPPRQFLRDMARYLADCMKVDLLGTDAARESGLTGDEIDEMANLVRDSESEFLAVLLNLLVNAADRAADSRNPELLAQAALVRAANLKGLSAVDAMITRLEAIGTDTSTPVPEAVPAVASPPTRAIRRKPASLPAKPVEPSPKTPPPAPASAPAETAPGPAKPAAKEPPPAVDSSGQRSDQQVMDMFKQLPAVDKVLGTFGGQVIEIKKDK